MSLVDMSSVLICYFNNIQEISLKKIYDEVTEDLFDMSHVRILKEIGDVYILLCLRSAELSKAFDLRNLCYS